MNKYSEMIKESIQKSGLSLSQIENELRKVGLTKNKSYLSNLQNGKVDPPSSEVSIALANILGISQIRLALVPIFEDIQESAYSNENFKENIIHFFFELLSTFVDMFKEEVIVMYSHLNPSVTKDQLQDFREVLNYHSFKEGLESIPSEELDNLLDKIIQESVFEESKDTLSASENNQLYDLTITVKNSDEKQFILESLDVYRKLKLAPNK